MAKLDKVSMSHVADSIQKQTIFYYPVSDRNSGLSCCIGAIGNMSISMYRPVKM